MAVAEADTGQTAEKLQTDAQTWAVNQCVTAHWRRDIREVIKHGVGHMHHESR